MRKETLKIRDKIEYKVLLQNILISIVSISTVCILLEISARAYLNNLANEKTFMRYASLRQLKKKSQTTELVSYKKAYHRYLGNYLTPNYRKGKNKHNSLGYRGDEITIPKPQEQYRIVCIGGSTTYTSGVEDYRHAYPELLERELHERGYSNVNVINAGAPGWSSWESLINFEFRIADIEPDMIIINHAINDIHTRFVWPPEAYKGDNSGRSAPNVSDVFMPTILEYSTLIRFFLIRAGLSTPHVDISRTLDRRAETFYGAKFQSQKIRHVYPQDIFKNVSAMEMLRVNKPVYFQRNIENIVVLAKHRGIRTILASFAYSPLFKNEPRASSQEYIYAHEEAKNVLQEIAAVQDVNFFDLASIFPKDKKYYQDGRHVNLRGARLKAQLFAQFIINNNIIPKE
ncbi:SGNH/GDSL hydrolase family protein [candidate division KSB1 bacterium]|nr:SGNH/GDSL hydrolase family protein [candidate division KSB1 bacterium]NIR72114.1 SGNH/GDSL hydrolase family protein [candidate division KSB1 bacterium]NIS26056.1 SGNH/GDSL hydrolase family protein [candidate division KSB1 bacterium]NIT71947.1 SGNH/GDSL hydrolase family protein [candidate division KSB1 bacterium]NIU25691.1 SGNH/GDSL hydrolase family protein [candidate division KSB1 bacterium]